ncbi:putative transformation/transcription domain-associated protein [Iris pallida]|uniref:Transformation/transcription domain-associated protein n=1 Tax=Iris pallida TaxID=29817 RepID=A0AAX6HDW1_IRIPA|nr:putative transformation/transcription domain-associated protein [Iris pallida]KAJ6838807.1 putative transformation/transcription domain-associated protein [Iris pallida]
MEETKKATAAPRGVVVCGSIAGLCFAHALVAAGWEVKFIEKSISPPSGIPTDVGLGLDSQSCRILSRWISDPDLIRTSTFPLSIELVIQQLRMPKDLLQWSLRPILVNLAHTKFLTMPLLQGLARLLELLSNWFNVTWV